MPESNPSEQMIIEAMLDLTKVDRQLQDLAQRSASALNGKNLGNGGSAGSGAAAALRQEAKAAENLGAALRETGSARKAAAASTNITVKSILEESKAYQELISEVERLERTAAAHQSAGTNPPPGFLKDIESIQAQLRQLEQEAQRAVADLEKVTQATPSQKASDRVAENRRRSRSVMGNPFEVVGGIADSIVGNTAARKQLEDAGRELVRATQARERAEAKVTATKGSQLALAEQQLAIERQQTAEDKLQAAENNMFGNGGKARQLAGFGLQSLLTTGYLTLGFQATSAAYAAISEEGGKFVENVIDPLKEAKEAATNLADSLESVADGMRTFAAAGFDIFTPETRELIDKALELARIQEKNAARENTVGMTPESFDAAVIENAKKELDKYLANSGLGDDFFSTASGLNSEDYVEGIRLIGQHLGLDSEAVEKLISDFQQLESVSNAARSNPLTAPTGIAGGIFARNQLKDNMAALIAGADKAEDSIMDIGAAWASVQEESSQDDAFTAAVDALEAMSSELDDIIEKKERGVDLTQQEADKLREIGGFQADVYIALAESVEAQQKSLEKLQQRHKLEQEARTEAQLLENLERAKAGDPVFSQDAEIAAIDGRLKGLDQENKLLAEKNRLSENAKKLAEAEAGVRRSLVAQAGDTAADMAAKLLEARAKLDETRGEVGSSNADAARGAERDRLMARKEFLNEEKQAEQERLRQAEAIHQAEEALDQFYADRRYERLTEGLEKSIAADQERLGELRTFLEDASADFIDTQREMIDNAKAAGDASGQGFIAAWNYAVREGIANGAFIPSGRARGSEWGDEHVTLQVGDEQFDAYLQRRKKFLR